MDAEVKIQVRGLCPSGGDVDKFRQAVNFVASTIERVVSNKNGSAATFDPLTGEPYNPLVMDADVIHSISAMSVASPHAMMTILTQNFSGYEDGMIEIAPITIDTSLLDD